MEILELQLLTDNIKETEKFYTGLLGLELLYKDFDKISFLAGHSTLTFHLSENKNPVYHFAFTVPGNKLDEAFQWAGPKFDILPVTPENKIADFINWNAKAFYFSDNNGNILEFIARFDLNYKTDIPFDSSSILAISETGFVVDNVTVQSNMIREKYNIPLFSKQPKHDNDFTVLGDDKGLLIMVGKERKWYPTDIKSKPFWAKITISNNGTKADLTMPETHSGE